MRTRSKLVAFLMFSAVAAGSVWFYTDRILVVHQVADAAAHDRPRGNLSDLYPRWLGARELLLHGRNPYSEEVTVEIQEGYYGRRLDASRVNDPKDQQGFAYPVYVVFLLAPLVRFPFHTAQEVFYWLELSLTAVSVWWWLKVLRWRLTIGAVIALVALTLGSFPVVQGLKLQQMSLLVAGVIAAAASCIAGGFLFWGGALLALSTIKPQLAWPSIAWLLGWALADWKNRKHLLSGFGLVLLLLLTGSEMLLPGWLRLFAGAVKEYHRYTGNQTIIHVLVKAAVGSESLASSAISLAAMLIAILATGMLLWRAKSKSPQTEGFGCAMALALALTVVIVPMYAPYNQILLLPSVFLLARRREVFLAGPRPYGVLYWVGGVLLVWQWAASLAIAFISLAGPPGKALDFWSWPLFSTFLLPVWIFGLTIFYSRREQWAGKENV